MRIKEKQDEDAWRLGIENKLRAAKGEPLLKTIEELDAKLDAEEAEDDAGDSAKKAPEDDAMIKRRRARADRLRQSDAPGREHRAAEGRHCRAVILRPSDALASRLVARHARKVQRSLVDRTT